MAIACAAGRFVFAFSASMHPSFTVARLDASALLAMDKLHAVALSAQFALGE